MTTYHDREKQRALYSYFIRDIIRPTPITYREINNTPPLIQALVPILHRGSLIDGEHAVETAMNATIQESRQYEPAYIATQAVRYMHAKNHPKDRRVGLEPTRIGIDDSAEATAVTMMQMGQLVIDSFRGDFLTINPREIPAHILKILKGEVIDLKALCTLDNITKQVVGILNKEMQRNALATNNHTALDFKDNTHSLVQRLQNMLSKTQQGLIQYGYNTSMGFLKFTPVIQLRKDTFEQKYIVPEFSEGYVAQFPELGIPQNTEVTESEPYQIMGELLRLGHPLVRILLERHRRLEQSSNN